MNKGSLKHARVLRAASMYFPNPADLEMIPNVGEQYALIARAKNGDTHAAMRIIGAYMRRGVKIAVPMFPNHMCVQEPEEVVGEIIAALTEAIHQFDVEKANGGKFGTMATFVLKDKISRYTESILFPCKITRHSRTINGKSVGLNRIIRDLLAYGIKNGMGRDDAIAYAISRCPQADSEVIKALAYQLYGGKVHLDALVPGLEDGGTYGSLMVDENAPCPEETALRGVVSRNGRAFLRSSLERLTPRERHIYVERKLKPLKERPTLEYFAKIYGVTKERIRQIEERAHTRIMQSAQYMKMQGEIAL